MTEGSPQTFAYSPSARTVGNLPPENPSRSASSVVASDAGAPSTTIFPEVVSPTEDPAFMQAYPSESIIESRKAPEAWSQWTV